MIVAMREAMNVVHARRALEALGAVVTEIRHDSKHTVLRFTTKEGVAGSFRVGLGPITDRHKLRGWARQAVTRTNARAEHARVERR